ncbi:sigma-54 interaction domain-containing protein [Candidatus Njordibacter sp. Uisw_058]|uniref:sigma-54 interaction domain-containing protein n=1 Tax=Candidatus Njordibacter sp. Uisw_058 TaxID=3230974 RepID=UPI003D4FEC88
MSITDSLLLGNSPPMQQVKLLIQQVAQSNASVLILGESGTGKELVAKALHQESSRCEHSYVPVNCGAIPSELLESELFGHEKGAFSGASSAKKGRFELADKGTLLLDEIGEMPLSMQVKLLRVLQEQVIDRVGSEKPRSIDVRIVAATHQNLSDKVAARDFREDLYYRLNVFPIQMPPLRERGEDILLLWNFFAQELCVGDDSPVTLSMAAAHDLMQRQWKGNCRELRNLVERMNILYPGAEITLQNLQPSAPILVSDMLAVEGQVELALYPQALESNPSRVKDVVEPPRLFDPLVIDEHPSNIDSLADMLVSAIDMSHGCDLKQQLIAVETQLIQKALDATSGNVSKAADLLSVRRTTLIEKIKKYQLQELS